MTKTLKTGDEVQWNWGAGKGEGKIEETFTEPVTRKIKGKAIKRNASEEKPAHLVKEENGAKVLKSATELKKA